MDQSWFFDISKLVYQYLEDSDAWAFAIARKSFYKVHLDTCHTLKMKTWSDTFRKFTALRTLYITEIPPVNSNLPMCTQLTRVDGCFGQSLRIPSLLLPPKCITSVVDFPSSYSPVTGDPMSEFPQEIGYVGQEVCRSSILERLVHVTSLILGCVREAKPQQYTFLTNLKRLVIPNRVVEDNTNPNVFDTTWLLRLTTLYELSIGTRIDTPLWVCTNLTRLVLANWDGWMAQWLPNLTSLRSLVFENMDVAKIPLPPNLTSLHILRGTPVLYENVWKTKNMGTRLKELCVPSRIWNAIKDRVHPRVLIIDPSNTDWTNDEVVELMKHFRGLVYHVKLQKRLWSKVVFY